jgi:hypothetical protein
VWIEYKSDHAAESDWDLHTPIKESQISEINVWVIPRLSSAIKVQVYRKLNRIFTRIPPMVPRSEQQCSKDSVKNGRKRTIHQLKQIMQHFAMRFETRAMQPMYDIRRHAEKKKKGKKKKEELSIWP